MNKYRIATRVRILGLAAAFAATCSVSGLRAQDEPATAPAETPAEAPPEPQAQLVVPVIPTANFAQRSPMSAARVSPDGKRIAFTVLINGVANIAARPIDERTIDVRMEVPEGLEFEWLRWAGNDRLIYSLSGRDEIYGVDVRYTRLYAVDIPTQTTYYVGTKRQGLVGDDVLFTDPAGQYVLIAMQRDIFTAPAVYRFPLDGSGTKNDEQIQRSKEGVWEWIADDAGVVRVGLGFNQGKFAVWYRKAEGQDFRVVGRFDEDSEDSEYWDVLRIVKNSDEGFMLEDGESGRMSLRRFNYATREVGEVVYENPDWDLTDFETDDDGNPVAVYFTDDQDRIVWLKPEMEKLQHDLEKALGAQEVWIMSRSKDDSRMLVWAGGATDPGAIYVYTPEKRSLNMFAEMRPGLHPDYLAPARAVTYTARDGTKIRSYLTLPRDREPKNLPLVILPHGGPYGVRDKLEYSDEVQLLANRGYAVLQPNYRGSDGFGEDFTTLGDGQIGRAMQDDLDDGTDWIVGEGIADADRVCVVGSSYGGYAALWAVIRNPERYRCAASFAGVTEWDKQLSYDADFFSAKGRKAWKTRIRGEDRKFDLDTVSPARQAARLTRPILLAHGEKDNNVPFSQFKQMRNALEEAGNKQAEYLTFKEAGHGFSEPADEQKWYDALVGFLAKHNPPD